MSFWRSTVGKKVVMGLTGLIMIAWLILHLLGNLQVFAGPETINRYAAFLHGPGHEVLLVMRAVLLLAIALHVVAALQLTRLDRAARPAGYVKQEPQAATAASRSLRWGGVLILVFIIYHLMHFTWGTVHPDFVPGDVYHNMVTGFRSPLVVGFYLAALAALGLHLYHGAWSSFRSLGAARPGPRPLQRPIALVLALLLWLGLSAIPIAIWFGWVK